MISNNLINELYKPLIDFPKNWEGRTAILQMRNSGNKNWKQMEWIGFYFEFLCIARLPMIKSPGPQYGNVKFDGFNKIPWDFKVHPENKSDGGKNEDIILNDKQAILEAIRDFNEIGIILALGNAQYNDKNRSFQKWHQRLKGGLSDYERKRIERAAPSRIRKTAFTLDRIELIILNKNVVENLPLFQKNFRNSNGSLRKEKLVLNMNKTNPIKTVKF